MSDAQAGSSAAFPRDADAADFVWRFKLDEKPPQAQLDHPLDELLRVQWEELLKLTLPMHEGKPVKIDGFAIMRDPKRVLRIFPDDPPERDSLIENKR